MTISNTILRDYIKITSETIIKIIDEGGFDSIEITGNINCCTQNCGQQENTYNLDLAESTSWFIDLTTQAQLENEIVSLYVKNIQTGVIVNVLNAPINDLSTVATILNNWFTGIGLTPNVQSSVDGNIVEVSQMPDDWIPYGIDYGIAEPYTFVPFGFTDIASLVFLGADGLYISPGFFGLTEFMDGVYKFTIKSVMEDSAGFITEANCYFFDITTKCRVATLLAAIKKEAEDKNLEQCSTMAHMLHYALVNASNCGCNCDELCDIYRELISILDTVDPNITIDCGC